MNVKYLALALMLLITTIPIVSADDLEPIKDTPKLVSFSYSELKTSFTFDIITIVKGWLGYTPQSDRVYVTVSGRVVAELPKDSKFIGIPVHDTCLKYQYGTNGWYDCEVLIK
jgi:hypothetical protein